MGWDVKGKGKKGEGKKGEGAEDEEGRGETEWDKSCMICIKNLNKLSSKIFIKTRNRTR